MFFHLLSSGLKPFSLCITDYYITRRQKRVICLLKLCGMIHQPPKYNKDFINDFSNFLADIMPHYDRVLVEDFNIHVCCPTKPLLKDFLDLFDSYFYSICGGPYPKHGQTPPHHHQSNRFPGFDSSSDLDTEQLTSRFYYTCLKVLEAVAPGKISLSKSKADPWLNDVTGAGRGECWSLNGKMINFRCFTKQRKLVFISENCKREKKKKYLTDIVSKN